MGSRCRNVIGQKVQALRKRKKLTQEDLAARCDLIGFRIGHVTISQIETGVRGVSDLEMILLARALREGIEELIPAELPEWKKDLRPPLSMPDEE